MKYALVTGGSRGIGRAVCIKLASMGIPTLINFQSNRDAAEDVRKTILDMDGSAELLQFDVANHEEVTRVLSQWEDSHPQDYIAYLVNNAGIRKDSLLFMMPDQDWGNVLGVTLSGFFNVTKALLPKMLRRGHGGRIVNMTSLTGIKGMKGQTNYGAAKAGIIGATKSLALETASRNVTVNAVAPGFIETDMTRELAQDELEKLVPMGRFGKPEEVAELVGFLCSDAASYITGEVISINGGLC